MANFSVEALKRFLINRYLFVLLVVLLIVFSLTSGSFRSIGALNSMLIYGFPILIVSFGQQLAVMTGGFDISAGGFVALTSAIASVTMCTNLVFSFVVVISVIAFLGLVNGTVIGKFGVNPIIATIGMMFFVQGLALHIRPSPGGYISQSLQDFFFFKIGDIYIVILCLFVLSVLIFVYILERTNFGLHIHALGGSEEAGRKVGINVDKLKIKIYLISGICCAIAGLFVVAQYGQGDPRAGIPLLFTSVTAVLLGGALFGRGIGRFENTAMAVILLAAIGPYISFMGVSTWFYYVVRGGLLIAAVSLQYFLLQRIRRRS